jgi:hypothetical protein
MGSASSWEPFRIFPHLLQPSYPFNQHSPRAAIKMLPWGSHCPPLTPHLPRRFFESGLEGRVHQICLRRHQPKGVSAGAAGNQLLPKPALEAQGNPTQLLGPPPVHSLQAPIPSSLLRKRLSFLSYHPKTPFHTHFGSVPTNQRSRIIF